MVNPVTCLFSLFEALNDAFEVQNIFRGHAAQILKVHTYQTNAFNPCTIPHHVV